MLSNVQNAIDILFSKGCNMVILTLGPLGAVYASKDDREITQISTTKVDPIDTTVRQSIYIFVYLINEKMTINVYYCLVFIS